MARDAVVEALPRPRYLYVASHPYSGSTLLAGLLARDARVAAVGGISSTRRRDRMDSFTCACGQPLESCPFWARVRATMQANGFDGFTLSDFGLAFDTAGRLARLRDGSLRNAALERARDRLLFSIPSEGVRLAKLGERHAAFAWAVLETSDATLLVDTSKERMRLRRLLQLQPYIDLYSVHLVRDVRGVVASTLRRGRHGGSAASAAVHWQRTNAAISRAMDEMSPDRRLLVRYEELCAQPEATVSSVLRFCDLHAPRISRSAGQTHLLGNRTRLAGTEVVRLDERWRSSLTAEQQATAVGKGGRLQATWYRAETPAEAAHG